MINTESPKLQITIFARDFWDFPQREQSPEAREKGKGGTGGGSATVKAHLATDSLEVRGTNKRIRRPVTRFYIANNLYTVVINCEPSERRRQRDNDATLRRQSDERSAVGNRWTRSVTTLAIRT